MTHDDIGVAGTFAAKLQHAQRQTITFNVVHSVLRQRIGSIRRLHELGFGWRRGANAQAPYRSESHGNPGKFGRSLFNKGAHALAKIVLGETLGHPIVSLRNGLSQGHVEVPIHLRLHHLQ